MYATNQHPLTTPPRQNAPTLITLGHWVGRELGLSSWIRMDQNLIDCFAACTGDHQWIHVDVQRARGGPFGGTIAHGWLTASLLAPWILDALAATVGLSRTLNYGVDRLRFLNPVKSNARLRGRMTLDAAEAKGAGQALLSVGCRVEIEGQDKPALVATALMLVQID